METMIGLIVLIAIAYAIVKSRSPRGHSEAPPTRHTRPGTEWALRLPADHDEVRRQRAEDAAFIEGALFAHYFLHDDPPDESTGAEEACEWQHGTDPDDLWDDDAFHDGFGAGDW